MKRLKEFYDKYLSKVNGYWLVTILFVGLTFTAGDSNLYKRYKYDKEIKRLEKEIDDHKQEIQQNLEKLQSLETNKEGLERFGREEYYMKKENEDVFIIK